MATLGQWPALETSNLGWLPLIVILGCDILKTLNTSYARRECCDPKLVALNHGVNVVTASQTGGEHGQHDA